MSEDAKDGDVTQEEPLSEAWERLATLPEVGSFMDRYRKQVHRLRAAVRGGLAKQDQAIGNIHYAERDLAARVAALEGDTPEPQQTPAERRTGQKLLDMVRPGWRERPSAAAEEGLTLDESIRVDKLRHATETGPPPNAGECRKLLALIERLRLAALRSSPTDTQKASVGEGFAESCREAAAGIPEGWGPALRVAKDRLMEAADRLAALRSVPAEPENHSLPLLEADVVKWAGTCRGYERAHKAEGQAMSEAYHRGGAEAFERVRDRIRVRMPDAQPPAGAGSSSTGAMSGWRAVAGDRLAAIEATHAALTAAGVPEGTLVERIEQLIEGWEDAEVERDTEVMDNDRLRRLLAQRAPEGERLEGWVPNWDAGTRTPEDDIEFFEVQNDIRCSWTPATLIIHRIVPPEGATTKENDHGTQDVHSSQRAPGSTCGDRVPEERDHPSDPGAQGHGRGDDRGADDAGGGRSGGDGREERVADHGSVHGGELRAGVMPPEGRAEGQGGGAVLTAPTSDEPTDSRASVTAASPETGSREGGSARVAPPSAAGVGEEGYEGVTAAQIEEQRLRCHKPTFGDYYHGRINDWNNGVDSLARELTKLAPPPAPEPSEPPYPDIHVAVSPEAVDEVLREVEPEDVPWIRDGTEIVPLTEEELEEAHALLTDAGVPWEYPGGLVPRLRTLLKRPAPEPSEAWTEGLVERVFGDLQDVQHWLEAEARKADSAGNTVTADGLRGRRRSVYRAAQALARLDRGAGTVEGT